MNLRLIPLIAGFLPIIAINLAYWIAANDGEVPRCIPYLEGCTSISSTGRAEPSKYLFRGIMLPEAVVMMIYWILCHQWLRILNGGHSLRTRGVLICGVLSSLFLILHVTFLGSEGEFYRLMRRIGTTSYFVFGYLAQVLMVTQLYALRKENKINRIPLLSWQLAICVVLLAVGLLNIPITTLENKDAWQNTIAWNFSVLSHVYFLCTYFAWRETNFSVKFLIESQRKSTR